MSKKVTKTKEPKEKPTADEVPANKKKETPAGKAKQAESQVEEPAASASPAKEEPAAKPAEKKVEAPALSGKELAASLVATDEALPKAWRESFSKRIHSSSEKQMEALRSEFREALVGQHEKSAPISEALQTERKEKREYRFLMSLAANTSGFDPKTRDQLSEAALAGKRDEFMQLLHEAILKDQASWAKIDQALAGG